jgi:hypothetical protein
MGPFDNTTLMPNQPTARSCGRSGITLCILPVASSQKKKPVTKKYHELNNGNPTGLLVILCGTSYNLSTKSSTRHAKFAYYKARSSILDFKTKKVHILAAFGCMETRTW